MPIRHLLPKVKFSRQFLLYFFIAQIVILLSNHQIFQEIAATPPGNVNLMVHRDWPTDYYSHLAYITQGSAGSWLRYAPYAVEPNKPGVFYTVYLFIGKVGELFRIEPHSAYHTVRLIAVELFVIGLYALSKLYLGSKLGALGAYFGLLSTVAPFYFLPQHIQITWYPFGYPWWESLDSLERLYMPLHHILGQAMMLWALYFLFLWLKQTRIKKIIAFIIFFLFGAITFPPIFIPFAIAAGPAHVFYLVRQYFLKKGWWLDPKYMAAIIIIYLLVAFIYILLAYHESLGYPWTYTKLAEIERWNREPSFDIAMPYVFGILPLLALPALIKAFINGKWQDIFIAIWAIIPFVLLPFADLLQFPKIRLVHENPYVPLGLLGGATLGILSESKKRWIGRFLPRALFIIFLVTVIPVSLSHLYQRSASVDYFLKKGDTRQFYVSQSMMRALSYLRNSVPAKSHIVSDYLSGAVITAYAPVVTLIGSGAELDLNSKNYFVRRFLYEKMPEPEAISWLKKYGIKYVFFGPIEKSSGISTLPYSFLLKIYEENDVTIYQVKILE